MRNLIIREPSSDDLATAGSIDGKPRVQAAAHRAVVLRNSWRRADTSWQQWQEQLAEAMKERIWEEYPNDTPAGNLTALLEQLEIDPKFALSREKFSDRPLPHVGRPKKGSDTIISTDDRGAVYNVRRLKRDNPDLAEQVERGELSPNAAAIKAGFRQREYRLPSDPQAAGRYLASRVDREWFDALIDTYYKSITE